ncbi:MAG TPA: GNAT family N-acetyltransferase [Bacilli bacterium]|nr:GNAT family N-acetyltransferase [Bacilli bacterium]
MEKVTFRAAVPDDLPEMGELFTKRPAEERTARMKSRYAIEPTGWHVAERDGVIVGCCQVVFPRPGDAWLQWMRIRPSEQGSGIGGAFSDYVEAQALRGGAKTVRLNTMVSNKRVHNMMGGARGYTEWARWTRLTGLSRSQAFSLARLREVSETTDADRVMEWLEAQEGHAAAFAAVTCPTDYKKTVSLDPALLRSLMRKKKGRRAGCVIAEQDGAIEGVALYAVRKGELRVLQLVASTKSGGLAAAGGAVSKARPRDRVSIQAAGAEEGLLRQLEAKFRKNGSKRHDFYVFGKRLEE